LPPKPLTGAQAEKSCGTGIARSVYTLFLAPFNPGDLGRLEDLEHRRDDIVGLG
jgi:hypothetical protein